MAEQNNERKKEIDADDFVRDYMESVDQGTPSEQNDEQTGHGMV